MKIAMRRLLVGVFVVLCSIRLTNYWGDYPDSFPAPLRGLGLWFVSLFERQTPEETADLEQIFVLAVSAVIVSVLTWLALAALKRWRSRV